MTGLNIREAISASFADVWKDEKPDHDIPEIHEDMILLETGLDSLGFAIFVARLDDELGYDPFTLDEDAYYPRTFGEFFRFYEKYASHAQ